MADLRDVEYEVEEANQAESQDYVFNAVEFTAEYIHLRNCLLDLDSSDLSFRERFWSRGYWSREHASVTSVAYSLVIELNF